MSFLIRKRAFGTLTKVREAAQIRSDWTKQQIEEIYNSPLLELVHSASVIHRKFHDPQEVQMCTLMNIKSGGCTEDCKYCAQSTRYNTGVKAEKMVKVEDVINAAKEAKANGSTRFCMGAAWRDMAGRKSGLKKIAEMVSSVNDLGLESCVTLGMLDSSDSKSDPKDGGASKPRDIEVLRDAGLTSYNHNIDTSREHYPSVISTRSFDERLDTIGRVRTSGVKVCTGGILGLGETPTDHVSFLHTLSTMPQHPESVPINKLVPIKGTPMGDEKEIPFDNMLRTIATARVIMPTARVRLAAGRHTMKDHEQAMCFMAGANSIFTGHKMLTTYCNGWDEDKELLYKWGLKPMRLPDAHTL